MKHRSQNSFVTYALRRLVVGLMVLCILSGPAATAFGSPKADDHLVYCPLAGRMVERNAQPEPPKPDLLGEFCAANATKDRFYRSLARYVLPSAAELSRDRLQAIFAEFNARGEDVLFRLTFPDGRPDHEKLASSDIRTRLARTQDRFDTAVETPFLIPTFPRPPTAIGVTRFSVDPVDEFSSPASKTRSRAPPLTL
jgi:hypothetical protein